MSFTFAHISDKAFRGVIEIIDKKWRGWKTRRAERRYSQCLKKNR